MQSNEGIKDAHGQVYKLRKGLPIETYEVTTLLQVTNETKATKEFAFYASEGEVPNDGEFNNANGFPSCNVG